MSISEEIAELLYPSAPNPDGIIAQYPPRSFSGEEIVTRFAPSPTGFVHIGSVYIAQIARNIARQSGGVFILRIEDTDQERKLERGIEEIVECLLRFGLVPDEGFYTIDPLQERGRYASYQQSQRRSIYQSFARLLVARGLAYPSFQTEEELQALREEQKLTKSNIGYYGPWARDRELSLAQVQEKLAANTPFVIRTRAPYPNNEKVVVQDAIRGRLEIPGNDTDHILLKSDGLPTYHFAVVIDDVLMGVNLVLRGDEWLGTLPLHVQLYEAFGFTQPVFAHIAPIGKKEGATKRKLSKRKDPEANVAYYFEKGYPTEAILAYLLNIADSSFEEWRLQNPRMPIADYPLKLGNMSDSIALFDLVKLNSVSRETIAAYSTEKIVQHILQWSEEFAPHIAQWIQADQEYACQALNIGRDDTPPRKDLTVWSDVEVTHGFFFDKCFAKSVADQGYLFPDLADADMLAILDYCQQEVATLHEVEKDTWVQNMKVYAQEHGYALTPQEYKRNPGQYKGTFGQFMGVYRTTLTNKASSPDLYQIICIMGTERVTSRIKQAQEWLRAKQVNSAGG